MGARQGLCKFVWLAGLQQSAHLVELATAECVDWYNGGRLRGALGDIPPAEFEQLYRRRLEAPDAA